jgi:hypothetical protein
MVLANLTRPLGYSWNNCAGSLITSELFQENGYRSFVQIVSAPDVRRAAVARVAVAGMDLDDSPIRVLRQRFRGIYVLDWEAP